MSSNQLRWLRVVSFTSFILGVGLAALLLLRLWDGDRLAPDLTGAVVFLLFVMATAIDAIIRINRRSQDFERRLRALEEGLK